MPKYPWELPPDEEESDLPEGPEPKPADGAGAEEATPTLPWLTPRPHPDQPPTDQPPPTIDPLEETQVRLNPARPQPPPLDRTRANRPVDDSFGSQPTRLGQPARPPTPKANPIVDKARLGQATPQQPARRGIEETRLSQTPPPQQPARLVPSARPQPQPTTVRRPQKAQSDLNWLRLIFRFVSTLIVLTMVLAILGMAAAAVGYAYIAGQLPPADELRSREFHFRTSTIVDRSGNVLWEINDPNFGRRTQVSLENISTDLRNATVATEDRNFYIHVGVDPIAVGRAVYYNVTEGSIVSGGSTITQQLVRNTLLSEDERTEQSVIRKVKEAVLAIEVANRYSKNEILEIYLNQIYYGNLAYGIEAASRTYFGKSAGQLTLAEAAMLAGLPQSPAFHDPYTNPEGAKARQEVVLGLMVEAGYITQAEAEAAAAEPILDHLKELAFAFNAPHFVNLVRAELETMIPADLIYQAGLRVETTLDQRLQSIAEDTVANNVNALLDRNVTNGALVALDPATGQILALVGSKDFRDEAIAGQINMAVVPRQPGSSIKPLVYLAAFEKGWTPSTLLMDVPVAYPDGAGGVYRPRNYDDKFHGPVSLRMALANSYNIPAVKTLEFVGVNEFKNFASRLGITSLIRDDYGLALALGGGEVPLLEMTGSYQAMANSGLKIKPYAIARILDSQGRDITPPRPQAERALSAEHAYLMTHILADNQARARAFGPNNLLNLSRPAAAKTGTTNDYRDNLVLGFTPDLVVGVWVGNADYTPMQGTTGLSGAGPIWHDFMERAHEGLPVRDFTRPPGIVALEVCADSGTLPSEVCPERRSEIFAADQPPLGPEHDIHQLVDIDRNTGLRANEFCRTNVETKYFRVYPPDGREWAISQGIEQPPTEFCPSGAIDAQITAPADGATVQGTIQIEGRALAANFNYYEIEYGVGTGPQAFGKLIEPQRQLVEGGLLGVFDTTQLDNGPYTLRLVVYDQTGGGLEARVRILIDNPSTPTPAPSVTPTDIPTNTPVPTDTPSAPPIDTPTPPPTLEPTPAPVETVKPKPTPTEIATLTVAPPSPTPTDTETPTPNPEIVETPTPESGGNSDNVTTLPEKGD